MIDLLFDLIVQGAKLLIIVFVATAIVALIVNAILGD